MMKKQARGGGDDRDLNVPQNLQFENFQSAEIKKEKETTALKDTSSCQEIFI